MAELVLEPAPGLAVRFESGPAGPEPEPPAWRIEGELEPRHSALRVLAAALADGSLLVLAAARPADASDHEAESVRALVVGAGGEREEIEEALVSTEYGADGRIRRVGLELYRPDEDYPLRAAGDATASERLAGARPGDRSLLDFRLEGRRGRAAYEIVRAGA